MNMSPILLLICLDSAEDIDVMFTYEVKWEPSPIKWASRWDTYLNMTDVQIHWFSIINSLVVVFFLAGEAKPALYWPRL